MLQIVKINDFSSENKLLSHEVWVTYSKNKDFLKYEISLQTSIEFKLKDLLQIARKFASDSRLFSGRTKIMLYSEGKTYVQKHIKKLWQTTDFILDCTENRFHITLKIYFFYLNRGFRFTLKKFASYRI